jgi:hypothetical protein
VPLKILLFTLLMAAQPCLYAGGIDSPYFKGGKLDAFYDRKDNGDFQVNSILWTPIFKGGHGVQVSETGGQDINYFGGFARPLLTRPELGDLILGAQEVLQGDSKQTEVQGEYRLPSGLGFGGGFVDRNLSNQDIKFAKISYRNEWQSIKYIVPRNGRAFRTRRPRRLPRPVQQAIDGELGQRWRTMAQHRGLCGARPRCKQTAPGHRNVLC